MNVRILIAAHKAVPLPQGEPYLPLHVGSAGKEGLGYQRDDEGENISEKNPRYCELTGLYWAWKNLSADAVGLVHYRRYFGKRNRRAPFSGVLSEKEAQAYMEKCAIVLPKKRRYYIETLWSHYEHTLHIMPLEITGEVLKEKYPRYFPEFSRLKKRRSAHMFNMMLMKREEFDAYCAFLFGVLEEVEKRVPDSEYADPFHARFPGRISELLLDVWLYTEKKEFSECPVFMPDGENTFKKAKSLIEAKFFGKKYQQSF